MTRHRSCCLLWLVLANFWFVWPNVLAASVKNERLNRGTYWRCASCFPFKLIPLADLAEHKISRILECSSRRRNGVTFETARGQWPTWANGNGELTVIATSWRTHHNWIVHAWPKSFVNKERSAVLNVNYINTGSIPDPERWTTALNYWRQQFNERLRLCESLFWTNQRSTDAVQYRFVFESVNGKVIVSCRYNFASHLAASCRR